MPRDNPGGLLTTWALVVAAAAAAFGVAALAFYIARGRAPRVLRTSATPYIFVLAAAVAVFFSVVALLRHSAFWSTGFYLGEYGNTIYEFGRGRPFACTVLPSENFYTVHFAPILAVFGPLTYIFSDPAFLFVFQAVALGGAVILIYYVAKPEGAPGWTAAALAAAFALSPAVHGAAFQEGIPRALAAPALLGAFYYYNRRRFTAGTMLAAVAALCQADVAVGVVGLAVYGGFATRRRRAGFVAAAAFAFYAVFVAQWLFPHIYHPIYKTTAAEVLAKENPFGLMKRGLLGLTLLRKLNYVTVLFLPLVYFMPRGAEWAPLVLPLAAVSVAPKSAIFYVGAQYALFPLPFVYGVAAAALRRRSEVAAAGGKSKVAGRAALAALLFSAFLIPIYSRAIYERPLAETRWGPREREMTRARALVPADAAVCASNHFLPHLGHRRYAYFPEAFYFDVPREPDALLMELPPESPEEFADAFAAARRWNLNLGSYGDYYMYFARDAKPVDAAPLKARWGPVP